MGEDGSPKVPEQICSRVQSEPIDYISRDRYLEKKYQYGRESDSEPIKAIQKEIDGMARLLCSLAEDTVNQEETSSLIQTYDREVENLRQLEENVTEKLPRRHD